MARIPSVKTETDSQGRLASVTINVKKHPQAIDLLKKAGLLEKSPLQKEIEENPDEYHTVDEVFDRLEESIKKLGNLN